MTRNKLWNVGAAALLIAIAGAAWANLDSPAGVGFTFPPSKGDKYNGFATIVFDDYTNFDLTAGSFEAAAQLQRRGELHAFHLVYACDVADPCNICDDTTGRIDITQAVDIALCLTDQIKSEMISVFGLGAVQVKLQEVSNFVSEVDPDDSSIRVATAGIQITVQ